MEHRKLSSNNMSELKTKDVLIPCSVIVIFESLQCFVDSFLDIPEDLKNKLNDLLLYIYNSYFNISDNEFGFELFSEDFKITYKYKDFLS